jgi:hypothetical protein
MTNITTTRSLRDVGLTMRAIVGGYLVAALTVPDALGQGAAPPAIEASPAIAARMHWITYHMVSGRVVASSGLSVPQMHVQSPGRRTRRRETLSIEINGGLCAIEYDLSAPDDELKISLVGDRLSIRRTRAGDRYTLDFQQRPDRPLSLVLEQADTKRATEADGFWQLYLAEPQLVRDHLVPLLELLHPSWQLAATGAEIENTLVHTRPARAAAEPDRKTWARLVAALASEKFSERENAERELYRAGQAVVPYLQSLDRARLDAEQGARIRSIVESLSIDYEDRPQRVAAWLAGDQRVWLALMARDDPARRRVAAERLAELLGEPVDFDPDAPADVRQARLSELRTRLENVQQAPHAE